MTPEHAQHFADLVLWRRDVRRFKTDAVPNGVLAKIIDLADHAPSVGNSQPWRIVRVTTPSIRNDVRANFERANAAAAATYPDDTVRRDYLGLKLEGFDAAPEHLAVFCACATEQGRGLGIRTMPEMLSYSCVSMIATLWYAARAEGLGLGWVSILDPADVTSALGVPRDWKLIGYLLLGYPIEEHTDPELVRAGWQPRTPIQSRFLER
ncbi:MAG: 5,6-dimethylbenzimidazole synthase [Hyphomicrobium sp.]|nr:5,6-dimethylbenzimidazole synthase [Hyphomicrobium sp.]